MYDGGPLEGQEIADRVARRYERVASYQNSGGETVCAGNNGKAKKKRRKKREKNVRHAGDR